MTGEVTGAPLLEFLEVMRTLRARCEWKSAQTHRSLVRYLLEETHETIEAIEAGDVEHLREELGDLMLQVWFHAVIAEEAGDFTLDDVAAGIVDKMRRRNPHVFGDTAGDEQPRDAASINEVWESIKATEKRRESVTDGLPASLPALLYADKVLDRLTRLPANGGESPLDVLDRHHRGTAGAADDIGNRLLAVVADAHVAGIDPEQALRDVVRRLVG